MAAKTQLETTATPTRRFGSFGGRTPSGGRSVGRLTQLVLTATPSRRYGTFSGKSSGGGGGGGLGAAWIFGEVVVR